nr:reverse transcriptase domain-containing protein [Tanacetum cinerariifolium]
MRSVRPEGVASSFGVFPANKQLLEHRLQRVKYPFLSPRLSRLVSDQSSNPTSSTNPNPKGRNRRRSKQRIVNLNLENILLLLLRLPINVLWLNFSRNPPRVTRMQLLFHQLLLITLSSSMVSLLLFRTSSSFGHDKEDSHAHIHYFNKITSTLKFPNVPNTSIKLMLFSFSLEGAARIWLEKEPPRSIFTWDDLVSKFINQFFPPSKTTSLRNEITNFQQRFDESFSEACDRFKDLIRACPHHAFSELHQFDTFYNTLNSKD